MRATVAVAIALRLALFAIADNKHGDAPSRALIADRMNREATTARDPREYRQFGPLHIVALRLFLMVDADLARGSRWLSLLAGIAVLFPFRALARRLVGVPAADVATLALACSPLHLQASTTAASEALYVLLLVCSLDQLTAALAVRGGSPDRALGERGAPAARREEEEYPSVLRRQATQREGGGKAARGWRASWGTRVSRSDKGPAAAQATWSDFHHGLLGEDDTRAGGRRQGRMGAFMAAGVIASLAAVTRYDAWIVLPAAAALAAMGNRRTQRRGALVFAVAAGALPAAWLAWFGAASGDPLALFRTIADFHAAAGADAVRRWGDTAARLRQVGIWALGFAAAMGPALAVAAAGALRRRPAAAVGGDPSENGTAAAAARRVVLGAALAPFVVYLGRGLLGGRFEPLARFALGPGVLLLPFAARRWLSGLPGRQTMMCAAVLAGAALWSATTLAAAWSGARRARLGVEALAPVTRLDSEDRALARHLRQHRRAGERVLLDTLDYTDIAVTARAGIPASESASLVVTRSAPESPAAAVALTGAVWMAAHVDSWLRRPAFAAAWPTDTALRFGGWQLLLRPPPSSSAR